MGESIKDMYEVRKIPTSYVKGWCQRHYAKRAPTNIGEAYGLYNKSGLLVGCCTFGPPANFKEAEMWKPFKLWELSRLIVEDDLPKNTTSFFVSQCLNSIEKPKVIISYADLEMGHYGYIYQACNWIYTGISGKGSRIYITRTGKQLHQRHMDKEREKYLFEKGHLIAVKKAIGKARYYYFCADKRTRKEMRKMLRFPILPYPKGDSKRYDASLKKSQLSLF